MTDVPVITINFKKKLDQQSTLFFLLSWPIIPLSGMWDNIVDHNEFPQSMLSFLFSLKKHQN